MTGVGDRRLQLYEIPRQLVRDPGYIKNANEAMVLGHESQYDAFGKEVVCEDGRITRVITRYKEIVG